MVDKKIAAEIEAFAQSEGLDLGEIPSNNEVDAAWCLRFLRSVRDASFATMDADGLPSVRIVDVMAVTDRSLYFLAPRGKAFHAEVIGKGYVALVAMTSDYRTCRLRGRAERPEGANTQKALIDALFDLNPGMNQIYPGDARYICDVFRVESGEGEYFDLGQKPIFRHPFSIGCGEAPSDSFEISGACTGCGTCASVCPESCIKEGVPFSIDQSHCLRCGLCLEACPAQAISKL